MYKVKLRLLNITDLDHKTQKLGNRTRMTRI